MEYNNLINNEKLSNYLNMWIKKNNASINEIKKTYLLVKKDLIATLLALNILTTSTTYSSGLLFIPELNNLNSLENTLDDYEYTQSININLFDMANKYITNILYRYKMQVAINNLIDYQKMDEVIRVKENLTVSQLNLLLNYMCNQDSYFNLLFESRKEAIYYLYNQPNRTYEEKMFIIMVRENLTYEQLDAICAGTIAEGYNYYEETYRVASVIYNRCHCTRYVNEFGPSFFDQFTATGQFQVYSRDRYQPNLGRHDQEGYKGAIDMFYSGIPSIDFLSFQGSSYKTDFTVQYMEGGNNYYEHLEDDERIDDKNRTMSMQLSPSNDSTEH